MQPFIVSVGTEVFLPERRKAQDHPAPFSLRAILTSICGFLLRYQQNLRHSQLHGDRLTDISRSSRCDRDVVLTALRGARLTAATGQP